VGSLASFKNALKQNITPLKVKIQEVKQANISTINQTNLIEKRLIDMDKRITNVLNQIVNNTSTNDEKKL